MKPLLTLLVCFLLYGVRAQTISMSEDITLRNEIAYELIGEMKGQLLLFRNRNLEFEIQGFDRQMKLGWSKLLELDKRTPVVLGFTHSKSDFTLFYQYRNRGNTVLKAHRYDPGANLIDSVTIVNWGYLFYTPNMQVVRSEDKSKVLFYFVERQTIVKAAAFDVNSMKLLWEKNFMPDDFIYGQDISHFLVNNDGHLFMIIERDNFRARKKVHYYEIYTFTGEGDLRSFNVPLEGKLTFDVAFVCDNLNNRLVGAGLYGEKDPERANGYFYMGVDLTDNKKHLLRFEPFDEAFLSGLLGKTNVSNKGLDEITVREIVLRKDGGALLIGERTKQLFRSSAAYNRTYYDPSSRSVVDYYYDDMFVISLHPDGATHWKNVLPKKQYSQDDDGVYSSYFLFKTTGNLRFLFNDEIRYENTVSEYIVNGIGEYDRNSILSTQNLELRLRFRDAIQISANELVVPSERRNRLRLVKFIYN
ncbi:MAG: hypothetical protein HUU34_13455 [Saprospiraceae bacterium]|nr:hypothetical protein [Saprospiraceae bacterium]